MKEVILVRHSTGVIVGDYPFADKVKKVTLEALKFATPIPKTDTNVKASLHTSYFWEEDNIILNNFKKYIINEVETILRPGFMADGTRHHLKCANFWAMIYEKGDYAQSHCHKPYDFSFAYFVKSNWYYSPLVFSDSGKLVRPKEGRFVAFPAFLKHHVPKHRYTDTRITLSGNFTIDRP